MGVKRGVISSRHRSTGFLQFSGISQDHLFNTVDNFDIVTGKIIEITIDTGDFSLSSITHLYGRTGSGTVNYRLNIDTFGRVGLNVNGSTRFTSMNIFALLPNQLVKIGLLYNGTSYELYLNDSLNLTSIASPLPNASAFPFYVGSNSGTGNFITGAVHRFRHGDDTWKLDEPDGFPCFSQNNKELTGSTINAGGLTYWNDNVRQKT